MQARSPSAPAWYLGITRTPLLGKLVVMDLGLNLATFLVLQYTPPALQEQVTLLSLGVVLVLNAALVGWALKPLQVLEMTTTQVAQCNYDARTVMPWMADRNLVRIGSTLDALLDRVVQDRARVRTLAAQVVAAGDQERARIARELHDGTAQSLAALDMLLSAMSVDVSDDASRERLDAMHLIVSEALQEVRVLCHNVHPRVLDDLGLQAALVSLVRRTQATTDVAITLDTEGLEAGTSREVGSVVYRVVQEAVHNALKHAQGSSVAISVVKAPSELRLSVKDDGVGFDPGSVVDGGLGLFVMDERVSLVEGQIDIDSAPGAGTTVSATIPMEAA